MPPKVKQPLLSQHHARSLELSKALVGKRILIARYMTDEELVMMGWEPDYEPVIFIVLDDHTQVVVQQDGEGNGPGRLLLVPKDQSTFIY